MSKTVKRCHIYSLSYHLRKGTAQLKSLLVLHQTEVYAKVVSFKILLEQRICRKGSRKWTIIYRTLILEMEFQSKNWVNKMETTRLKNWEILKTSWKPKREKWPTTLLKLLNCFLRAVSSLFRRRIIIWNRCYHAYTLFSSRMYWALFLRAIALGWLVDIFIKVHYIPIGKCFHCIMDLSAAKTFSLSRGY